MTNLKIRLLRIEGNEPAAGWEPVAQIVRVIVSMDGKPQRVRTQQLTSLHALGMPKTCRVPSKIHHQ